MKRISFPAIAFTLLLPLSLASAAAGSGSKRAADTKTPVPKVEIKGLPKSETATFAGGCFWCMQPPFDRLKHKGVISTRVGYTGGHTDKPTYEQISSGTTGHYEAIEVVFDPGKISYVDIAAEFWKNIDPFDAKGQFCDKGQQYTSAIFFHSEAQKNVAETYKNGLAKETKVLGEVATLILPAKPFFPAEHYHQSYYSKNPLRYKFYRFSCGRDKRLKEIWGKSD